MTSNVPGGDRDLLARLNALRKTHIDLDDKQYECYLDQCSTVLTDMRYKIPIAAQLRPVSSEPSAVKALHSDLLSRFQTLNGTASASVNRESADVSNNDILDEDSKTVEALLADLGPDQSWNIEGDEEAEITNLLNSARTALKDTDTDLVAKSQDSGDLIINPTSHTHTLPSIDLEIYQPEDSSDEDSTQPRKSKTQLEADLNHDADEIVAKIQAELEYARSSEATTTSEDKPLNEDQENDIPNTSPHISSNLNLPSTPSKDPVSHSPPTSSDPDPDSLTSRFNSLSLPSVPSTLTTTSPPTSKPNTTSTSTYSDAQIESWCCICNDDATLTCPGCDGDLYCTSCWLEGHRGEDAGYEERSHKALQYTRGGGGEKQDRRKRVGIGA